jgi:alpha-mannosidase
VFCARAAFDVLVLKNCALAVVRMKFDEVVVLLPCQSLDEFPAHLAGIEAEGLLAAWSAIWHPALIAATGKLPGWRHADTAIEFAGKLVVVPAAAEKLLPEGTAARTQAEGGRLISSLHGRAEIVRALLAALAEIGGGESAAQQLAAHSQIDAALVDDFLALGTCQLYGELLARRMRYGSTVDEERLQNHTVAAANAAVNAALNSTAAGNAETARHELSLAFGVLLEARGRYYPVDSSLVDLTVVASTTIGASLRKELARIGPTVSRPINLLLSADVLAQMVEREPESAAALKNAVQREAVSLVGGETDEAELPLLEPESVLWNLMAGLAEYERLLGHRPVVYGRRRYGLTPILPQILFQLGFRGAVHFTLDDGRFPQADGGKARWEGLDVMGIDALSRVPLDASLPESMLGLAEKLGHAMDHDQVATVAFAHWPGQGSMFYDDLRRAAAYAPVLGKFVMLDSYFAEGTASGSYSKFTADQYRTPYLQQAIEQHQADAISRWVRHQQRCRIADSRQTIATLVTLLRRADATDATLRSEIERLLSVKPVAASTAEPDLDRRIRERLSSTVADFSAALPRDKTPAHRGYLILNAANYKRRVLVDVSELTELPSDGLPVLAAEEHGGKRRAIVELPPVGFAWVAATSDRPARAWAGETIASSMMLRNEHCEVRIHPETGGIQSIHDYKNRANRLSQQLTFRLPPQTVAGAKAGNSDADESADSRMVADSIEVTDGGRLFGEITSRGRLLDSRGELLADFTQRVQMSLGNRVVVVEIELNPSVTPQSDPWRSYYACRFAWAERAADLARDVHLAIEPTTAKRIEAPHFLELQAGARRMALLTGGLPYHCRVGTRMLDTLLIVEGETARRFRIGIGIDLPHLWSAALDFNAPETLLVEPAAEPLPARHSWLFHVDARNVCATHWEPIVAGKTDSAAGETQAAPGSIVGFRVRLFELEGRAGRVGLRSFRTPKSARRTDFLGQATGDLIIEEDRILIDLGAFEWLQLEARW